MAKYQYGCSKVETGEMDPETGELTWDADEIAVYEDVIEIDKPEAPSTPHYKVGDANPIVTRYGKTARTISFRIADMSSDSKVRWLGGTKTTVTGKDTWNEPTVPVNSTVKALRFTLEDGSVIIVPVGECAGRLAATLNETDIATMPIVATVKSTGIASVSAFQWTD